MIKIRAGAIQRYRDKHQCSMQEAKIAVTKRGIKDSIRKVEDENVKDILFALMELL